MAKPHRQSPCPGWVKRTHISYGFLRSSASKRGWNRVPSYYLKFKENYPNVHALANAREDEVYKLWEGLGYYNRASNMLATARKVSHEYDGVFPSSYDELIQLRGIGPYTAAAIASFAFNEPKAVVDGNVIRVLSRYFGIEDPVNQPHIRQQIQRLADQLISAEKPGPYNQAIMDLGALICKPRNPQCTRCPLMDSCSAYGSGKVKQIPLKIPPAPRKKRHFHYIDITCSGLVAIRKRKEVDIWRNLFEFPLIETASGGALDLSEIKSHLLTKHRIQSPRFEGLVAGLSQTLSHQQIHANFYKISIDMDPSDLSDQYLWIPRKNLSKFAFPKLINSYIGNT